MEHNIDNVHKQLAYKPFRPFWLETVGGTRIQVARAEWFHEVPDLGALVISDYTGVTITYWHDLTETIEVEGPAYPGSSSGASS
jgi:hypothetical protein